MQLVAAQTTPVVIHYHHGWLIWLLFLLGDALHVALQVDNLARSSKLTYKQVIQETGIKVLYRAFACAMVFGLLWQDPAIVSQIAKLVGFNISADEAEVFAIPINNAIAGLYGLFLDSLLGYIPFLKSQLPEVGE